jgi:hypothetical protein
MIVLLHAYRLGFTAWQVAIMFTLYELAGVVTNLLAGLMGAKWGIKSTLLTGGGKWGGPLAGGGAAGSCQVQRFSCCLLECLPCHECQQGELKEVSVVQCFARPMLSCAAEVCTQEGLTQLPCTHWHPARSLNPFTHHVSVQASPFNCVA